MESEEQTKDDSLVPEYSNSFEEPGETDAAKSSKPRRNRDAYHYSETFNSKDEALKKLGVGSWGIRNRSVTDEGEKTFYRCKKVKARGEQCTAAAYLLMDATSHQVMLYRSDAAHSCDTIATKSGSALTDAAKTAIEQFVDMRIKNLAIIDRLTQLGHPVPKYHAVANYVRQYREKKFGPPTISLAELRSILDLYTDVPASDDSPFVVYETMVDDNNAVFRFFMTSKALIEKTRNTTHLNADATYKLLWQGFPVLIVGTTDMDRKFHILGVSVCTNEQEADFRFTFAAIKKSVNTLLGEHFAPKVLICDAAKAISNGFKKEFGSDAEIMMCWTHMISNVKNRLRKLVNDAADRKKIMDDLHFIQGIHSVRLFKAARELFLKKWAGEGEFLKYFAEEWIEKNPNWFEAAKIYVPSTNNALEATNRVVKDNFALRLRYSIGQFINEVLVPMIGQYSRRCSNTLKFATTPTISNDTWTASYMWARLNQELKKEFINASGATRIVVKSSTFKANQVVVAENWTTLEELKMFNITTWQVQLEKNKHNWLQATCTCPIFQKEFVCKHNVGIAVRMHQVSVPDEVKNAVQIGAKRKRGRVAKSKKALVRQ